MIAFPKSESAAATIEVAPLRRRKTETLDFVACF